MTDPSPRTSLTDPLRIGELQAGGSGGLLGITFCPGKQGDSVMARGIAWRHLPIVDLQPPGPAFDDVWPLAGSAAVALLRSGGRVLVHCRGGLGRAGTVAACLLVECGQPPAAAIRAVRAARPGAIETAAQQHFVEGHVPRFGAGRDGAGTPLEDAASAPVPKPAVATGCAPPRAGPSRGPAGRR